MSDNDMDLKLAADAVEALPHWMQRAKIAEAKVAEYERKERVQAIVKKAEQKQAILPKVDLMKCSEDTLIKLEASLDMIGPQGNIQFGDVEGGATGSQATVPHTDAQQAADAMRSFMMGGAGDVGVEG